MSSRLSKNPSFRHHESTEPRWSNPLPETKPASLHLKMDAWNTILYFLGVETAYFQGAILAVRFRECLNHIIELSGPGVG